MRVRSDGQSTAEAIDSAAYQRAINAIRGNTATFTTRAAATEEAPSEPTTGRVERMRMHNEMMSQMWASMEATPPRAMWTLGNASGRSTTDEDS